MLTVKSVYLAAGFAAVVYLTASVTNTKFADYRAKLAENNPNYLTTEEVERNLDCLAINIYREAGNEPFEGMVGVAQVTLNRVESGQFPNTVCGVVYQKNRFMEKVVCQFSWYCQNSHMNAPINKNRYNESYEVAKKVYLENFRLSSLNEALYYHADYVNPNWRLPRVAKIGHHIFYKGIKS